MPLIASMMYTLKQHLTNNQMRLIFSAVIILVGVTLGNQAIDMTNKIQDNKMTKYCQIDPNFSELCNQ